MSLFEWLYRNLCDKDASSGIPCATMFALATWWGWKWRCGNVFGENRLWRYIVQFLRNLAKEVISAKEADNGCMDRGRSVTRMIGWTPPRVGWMKLNADGASHGNPGPASAGGVLCNGEGEWCGGFAHKIGRCSAPLAELWGVYYGLVIAWEKGISRLELEVDSKMVVEFLTIGIGDSHPLSFLVRLCHGFLTRDWLVRIVHVYRDANRLADGLANLVFSLSFSFHKLDAASSDVVSLLREDVDGPLRP